MADINNSTSTTLVSGTSSADKIYNSESNVTIAGDAGNDFIYTDSWKVQLMAVRATTLSV